MKEGKWNDGMNEEGRSWGEKLQVTGKGLVVDGRVRQSGSNALGKKKVQEGWR